MKFEHSQSDYDLLSVYRIEITRHDFVKANLRPFDKLLIRECESSDKVSDKLLALETIARRIEEAA